MNGSGGEITSFGPFRLSSSTRQLSRDGTPLALGDRALDILIVLVEHAGHIVSQKDLMSRVWRDLVVTPGNLRVHMSALRKALGDGESGARYIENVTGQGYCFVAAVQRGSDTERVVAPASGPLAATPSRGLPLALTRMVGREDTVRTIAADIRTDRFVTIVGPGGMGKTTVAICVAHVMKEEFDGAVCFVDFGAIADAALLSATVATTLGLPIQSADSLSTLISFLRGARMLLVLDNCEHVIDAAASLAEAIFSQAPDVHLLATSREALRVEGERAHWLHPLASPTPDSDLRAGKVLTFPAIKLFVDRAMASDNGFQLTDANAPIVADICGRLDGIALALELVAGRVGTYGLTGTAELLNKRLGLHWQGRRTALPRHQTLHALLDWSYSLLPAHEQRILRKLSTFIGAFTLDAAHAVASDADSHPVQIAEVIDHLIAKSLVSVVRTHDGSNSYRLLETTRLYAMGKLEECAETDATAQRHARYFTRLMSSLSDELHPLEGGLAARHDQLGNLRSALEWSMGDRAHAPRDAKLAIDLATAAAPTLLEFSLWSECQRWSEAALSLLDDATRGGREELVLQEARAIASMWTRGNSNDVRLAILRGLEIAQRLGATVHRLRLLTGLHTYLVRTNDFKGSLNIGERMADVARETNDESCMAMADWLRGSSNHFLGNQAAARQYYESGFARGGVRTAQHFGLDYRVRALAGFSRALWLNGYPQRAQQMARQAIDEAALTGKPINTCFSLIYTCHVFLWCGDLAAAQDSLDRLTTHPFWQALPGFHSEGFAMQGELLVLRGEFENGADVLRRALRDMKSSKQTSLRPIAECRLAEVLAASGHFDEARTLIDEAIAHAPGTVESLDASELLRVKANILLFVQQPDEAAAEDCLVQSLAHAQRQCARGWELRTATTLARLRVLQGRDAEARELLSNIYAQFTEGFDTADLATARRLLSELERTDAASVSIDTVLDCEDDHFQRVAATPGPAARA
jgi:predicted ATPase/DNA-binding winged helix-turn-helix (wHTH) protein